MKKYLLSSMLIGSSLLAMQAANAFEIKHSEGVLELEQTPQKVVSYDLAQLDTLTALGIEAVAVPTSSYKNSLERYNDSPTVGTLFEPDYEALKKIGPDLIIAGGRSAAAIPELSKIAPTISFTSDPNNFVDSVKDSTNSIAKAWDKEAEGKALLEKLEQNIAQLHELNKGKTGAFLFVIKDRVMTHAPGDRFGYIEELTGLKPILSARTEEELNQPRPKPDTPEAKARAEKSAAEISTVAKANPDWFIVLDRGALNDAEKTAANTLNNHEELSKTDAVKEGRVFYVEPNPWYVVTGGVSNLTEITDQMIEEMKTKN